MTTLQPGAVLGRYVLGEVLGRGGVGVVHAATHATLHTEHALKVLRVDDPEGRRRLLQEGRTQARLSHENVVAVRDALTLDDGRPVLVFDRVRGPSLRTLLRHASLPEPEALRLWTGIVRGVAHAHAHGVVHRDLKPGNVLLDTTRTPSIPRVTDFGIARCLAVEGATAPGQVLGSPGYLAPEQLLDAASAGPPADVFSLGVLLVELLTGEPPHEGVRGAAWLAAVDEADGVVPDGVPDALAPLVRRCLRSRPEDRFPDAAALLGAIEPSEATAVPEVRSADPVPSTRKSALSGAVPVGLVGIGTLALGWALGGALTAGWGAGPAGPIDDPAASLERRAWTRAADHPGQALALLRAAAHVRGEPIPDSLVLDLVDRGAAVHVLPMVDSVPAVGASGGRVAGITTDGELTLWDGTTGREITHFSTGVYQPRMVQLLEDDGGVVLDYHHEMGSSRTEAVAWDLQGRALVGVADAGVRMAAGEHVVAVVGEEVIAWDRTGAEAWRLAASPRAVLVAAEPGSVHVLDGPLGRQVRLRDGREIGRFEAQDALISLAPDRGAAVARTAGRTRWVGASGQTLGWSDAVVSRDAVAWPPGGGRVALWSPRASEVELLQVDGAARLDAHERQGALARFLDDGHLVSTSWDGQVRLWGERGQLLHTLARHGGLVPSLEVDGDRLVTGSLDGTVRIWARPDRLLGALATHEALGLSRSRRVVGDGPHVYFALPGGDLLGWHPGAELPERFATSAEAAVSAAGGGTVAAGAWEGEVHAWRDGQRVRLGVVHNPVRMAVSPDGQRIAVASRTRLQLWSVDGTALASGPLTGFQVALAFSPDSSRLYVGHGERGQIDVWLLDAATAVQTLRPERTGIRGVSALAATEDGVVAGFYGGAVASWSADGTRRWSEGSAADVVLVRADGDRVLVAAGDGRTWMKRATGELLAEVRLEEMVADALLSDGTALLGDVRGRLTSWQPDQPTRVRPAHRGPVATLFREGDAVWSVGEDGLARAWRADALSTPVGGVAATGSLTNLRVCPHSHQVVPVVPFPDPETVWAPAGACGGSGQIEGSTRQTREAAP